jgi:hypothetical protein
MAAIKSDFTVENFHGDFLYTPETHRGFDWAQLNLKGLVFWGRSFIVPNVRGSKLISFLRNKEDFALDTSRLAPLK